MDLNTFKNFLIKRASHRKFKDEGITKEDITKIVDCARFTPSGHNQQPWKFVAVTDKKLINTLADKVISNLASLYPSLPEETVNMLEKYKFFLEHFRGAPLIILVFTTKNDYTTSEIKRDFNIKLAEPKHFDMELLGVGAVVNNILLACEAAGYVSCWLTEPVVYAQKEIEEYLKEYIEDNYNFVSLITVGRPVKERTCAPKKEVTSILSII
jgi:nitroreductase